MCTRLETMTQILLTAFEELTPNECFHSFCDFTRRGLANDSDLVTLLESLIQHNRIDIQMCLMPMIHCSKPQLVDVLLANNVNVHRGGAQWVKSDRSGGHKRTQFCLDQP